MPGMSDHFAKPMAAPSDTHASTCEHCHSHTQGHGCLGFHGCSAPLAAPSAPSVSAGLIALPLVLLPVALPRVSTLAFEPPLRPPPA